MWNQRIQRLINHTLERSLGFKNRLEELQADTYASQAPLSFIKLLQKLNYAIFIKLVHYNNTFLEITNPEVLKHLFYKIRSLSTYLAEIYDLVSVVEFSKAIRNPVTISVPIEQLAKNLAPESTVLVYPSYVCNYSYVNLLSDELLKNPQHSHIFPESIFEDYPKPYFVLLAFPDILRDNILSHAIFGHELGHLIAEFHNIYDEALQEPSSGFSPDLSLEDISRFFEEYTADIVSIYLFGPASFFSLIEFSESIISLEEHTSTHPPTIFRAKNMLKAMEKYGYLSFFKIKNETAEKAQRVLEDWSELVDEICGQLENTQDWSIFLILEPALNRVKDLVIEKLGEESKLKLDRIIFKHIEGWIKLGVPVSSELINNSDCHPIDYGSILNAGWLYRIWKFDQPIQFESIESAYKYGLLLSDLSRLTAKAIDQSKTVLWLQERG